MSGSSEVAALAGVGFEARQFSVADHASGEHTGEIHQESYCEGHGRRKEKRNGSKKCGQGEKDMKQAALVKRGVFEAHNERDQIQAQWQYPEERKCRYVLANKVC